MARVGLTLAFVSETERGGAGSGTPIPTSLPPGLRGAPLASLGRRCLSLPHPRPVKTVKQTVE